MAQEKPKKEVETPPSQQQSEERLPKNTFVAKAEEEKKPVLKKESEKKIETVPEILAPTKEEEPKPEPVEAIVEKSAKVAESKKDMWMNETDLNLEEEKLPNESLAQASAPQEEQKIPEARKDMLKEEEVTPRVNQIATENIQQPMREVAPEPIRANPVVETPVKKPESETQSSQYDEVAANVHNSSPEGKAVGDSIQSNTDATAQRGISVIKTEEPVQPPREEAKVIAAPPIIPQSHNPEEDNSPEKQSERGGDNARTIEAQRYVEEDKRGSPDTYMAPSVLQYGFESNLLLFGNEKKLEESKKRISELESENRKCIFQPFQERITNKLSQAKMPNTRRRKADAGQAGSGYGQTYRKSKRNCGGECKGRAERTMQVLYGTG